MQIFAGGVVRCSFMNRHIFPSSFLLLLLYYGPHSVRCCRCCLSWGGHPLAVCYTHLHCTTTATIYIHIHPYPVHGARASPIASNIYMNTTTTKIPVALMVNLIFSHSPSVRVSGIHCCILRSILDCHFLFLHSTIPSCHYLSFPAPKKKKKSLPFFHIQIFDFYTKKRNDKEMIDMRE